MNRTQLGTPTVRRAGEPDTDALAQMLTGLTDLSRWFRFQTAIGDPPRPALLLRMLRPTGAAFVATCDGTDGGGRSGGALPSTWTNTSAAIVGHAMWAWGPGESTAELAAVISEDHQRHGLGIRMLSIAAADAIAAGATQFLFVVNAANDRTIRMIRRRWPQATVDRDGPQLTFVTPARLPDHPEGRPTVLDGQLGCFERSKVPTTVGLEPAHDPAPAL